MHTKNFVILAFGLIIACGVVNAVSAPLRISPNGDPRIQLGFGDTVNFTYLITNVSNKPHQVFFNNTYPVGSVRQLAGTPMRCIPTVMLQPTQSCQIGLQIIGSRIPPGGFAGGPEVCIGTPPGLCSQPTLFEILTVNR